MNATRVLFAALAVPFTALAGEPLGDANMAKANRAASTLVEERMKAEAPEDHRVLRSVDKADIVVVRGTYDRVEDVLDALKMPHVTVDPIEVATLNLNAKQLLIVDCPGEIGPKGIERIRKFVNAGGFLYTTDWALVGVVQKAFPGYIAYNQHATANDVVEVEAVATQNNLLKHLTLSKTNPKWWLESSSYPIKVLDAEKVEVLISSKEMKKKYGEAPIAVSFRYGDGQVLHIASHFYLQQNQNRTAADKKVAKSFVKEDSNLAPATKAAMEKSGALSDDVAAGDLSSAYSAQQMTSNLVVERKKDQGRITNLYNKRWDGKEVKPLETRGEETRVRTMDGNEQWVPTAAVK